MCIKTTLDVFQNYKKFGFHRNFAVAINTDKLEGTCDKPTLNRTLT